MSKLQGIPSVVSPSALYGLTAAPLTKHDIETLAIAQRRMLRMIVGCVKLMDDDWADFHRRMNARLQVAFDIHAVRKWDLELRRRKSRLFFFLFFLFFF